MKEGEKGGEGSKESEKERGGKGREGEKNLRQEVTLQCIYM